MPFILKRTTLINGYSLGISKSHKINQNIKILTGIRGILNSHSFYINSWNAINPDQGPIKINSNEFIISVGTIIKDLKFVATYKRIPQFNILNYSKNSLQIYSNWNANLFTNSSFELHSIIYVERYINLTYSGIININGILNIGATHSIKRNISINLTKEFRNLEVGISEIWNISQLRPRILYYENPILIESFLKYKI